MPDIDATTSAGRMVLIIMASVAGFEAPRISECAKEVLTAAKIRGARLRGSRSGAAEMASERKQTAIAEAGGLYGVLAPMVRAGFSDRAVADAFAGVGKLSSTGRPLAPAQSGRHVRCLRLSGTLLDSDQAWLAA